LLFCIFKLYFKSNVFKTCPSLLLRTSRNDTLTKYSTNIVVYLLYRMFKEQFDILQSSNILWNIMKCSLVKNVRLKDFVKYQYLTVKTHVIVPTYIILCYLSIIQKYYFTILRCVTCSKFCFKSYKSKSCLTLKFNHYSNMFIFAY